jgi:hypothetical protein
MMEAVNTIEKSVNFYQTAQCSITKTFSYLPWQEPEIKPLLAKSLVVQRNLLCF